MSNQNANGRERFEEFLATHRVTLSSGKVVPTQFFTIQDMKSILNINQRQAEKLFRCKGFPACTFGKEKVVEANAFLEFWLTNPEMIQHLCNNQH